MQPLPFIFLPVEFMQPDYFTLSPLPFKFTL